MNKYNKYKPSGIEWIGEIPEHWEVKKLKYLISNNDGGVWGNDGGNFYVLRSTEINVDGSWNYENEPAIRDLSESEFSKSILKEGDLLITKSSGSELHIGKTGLVNKKIAEMKCCFSNFMQRIRPQNNQNPNLLFHHLNSKLAREQYNYLSNTTTGLANLSAEIINSILFPVPPTLDEQIAIANFLDQKTAEIDELIKQKEELLLLFEEEKKAVINHAVTKGIDQDAKLKDSKIEWLGEIPEHWELTKLKYVTNKIGDGIHTTPTYTDFFEIYFINGTNLENGKIRITEGTRSVDEEEYEKHRINLEYGTILISLNGTIGKMAFYNGEKVILGKSAAYIECKKEINNEFVYYFLQSNYLKNCFEESFSGTTINNLSLHTLRNTKLVVPERNEQDRIVEFIKQNILIKDIQIENTLKLIGFLKDYKIAMISEVATGKVRVI